MFQAKHNTGQLSVYHLGDDVGKGVSYLPDF